ncbi:DUF1552 domain-containing protein [Urbifossiella limnaea]|uniref:DUF1552 domain-containing protein n=1 Tax=Urbifossiella limnaea TaxID=2528023 RepID=A0A517XQJ2_9BACT|nr:DUF1552 domain-containing protein [Urbifossiella limnaea]QDU19777.1 hypothetical protein ETAA1_17140 [Urbifossiella limnaea]
MFVDRRDALKGLGLSAGATLLTPILTRLKAQASGAATVAPKRFVFVVESNGVRPEQLAPEGVRRQPRPQQPLNGPREFVDVPLRDKKLPFSLEPIAAWKDKVTIVNGLSGRVCGGGHSNNFHALGAFGGGSGGESMTIAGETVDGALAKHLGGIFPHIGLGISKRPENNVIYNVSAWAANQALPTMCRPDTAYNTLFGIAADGAARQEFAARNNLLDFLKDDVRAAERSLAGPEREQFAAYLETFETLRNRQSRLNEIRHTLREKGPVVSNKYTSPVETDRLDAQFDVGAAALICGLTNVLTLSSAAGVRDFDITFRGLGLQIDKHTIGHGGSYQGKTWAELYDIIRRYHFDLIAGLLRKLQAVPEGNGTMLDNTVLVYLSDGAESHHSRCWEWPMVVIGDLGGKLKTGRYVDYPGYGLPGHRTTANLYLTLLHLAGARRDTFGSADPALKDLDQTGPLAELLA